MPRTNWTERPQVLALRRRSAPANALVTAIDHYVVHRTGRHAALICHYGFLAIFPLFLAFTTILGLLLRDNQQLADDIIDSALSRIPIIGEQIATAPEELTGSVPVLIFGLIVSLWAGLRAFNVIQTALDDIQDIPLLSRRTAVQVRLWSLFGIVVVGSAQIVTTVVAAVIAESELQLIANGGLLLATVAINAAVVGLNYHFLCSKLPRWKALWPGALASGIVFTILGLIGTNVVSRYIARASAVYGTFASVIALFAWLSLHATTALLGAELNRVLPVRRYAASTATA